MLYSKVVRRGSCPCPKLVSAEYIDKGATTCTLVAVNCIRTIYKLLFEQVPVIGTLSSIDGFTAVVDIAEDATLPPFEDMNALMGLSHFQEELTHRLVECRRNGVRGVGGFLYECFDILDHDSNVTSLVLSQSSQSMACIKFRLAAENLYLVMDPHVRNSHPEGPALLLSHDLAEIVHYIDDALQINPRIDSKPYQIDVAPVTIHAIQPRLLAENFSEADFLIPSHHDLTPVHSLSRQTSTEASTSAVSEVVHDSILFSSSPLQDRMPGDWIWEDELRIQLQKEEHSDSTPNDTSSSTKLGWLSATLESMQSNAPNFIDGTNLDPKSSVLLAWDHQLAIQLQEEELDRAHDLDVIQMPDVDGNADGMVAEGSHRNAQEHVHFLEEIVRRRDGTTLRTLELPPPVDISVSAECGICHEMHLSTDGLHLPGCSHSFCNECLQQLVKSKLQEGRYPIFCPECHIDRSRSNKTQIDQGVIETLGLSKHLMDRLSELQLISHSVVLHCPRCNSGMSVDRERLQMENIVICPLSGCCQHWCKSCNKQVASSATKHRCKHVNIDRLMRRKGWKYCPGCQTPIQKESGCNHITCGAPGCNVHFCYKCCVLIIDTTNGGDVGTAVTDHYTACQLFEKRFKCTIQ